eukprot:COSAG01_NODE_34232_length_551_cov_0.785398_1_plen_53_part_01
MGAHHLNRGVEAHLGCLSVLHCQQQHTIQDAVGFGGDRVSHHAANGDAIAALA